MIWFSILSTLAWLQKEELMSLIERILNTLFVQHPIHPMIVHFPVGLTGAALFFILLALLWKRARILEQVAFANLSLAAVSTVVAAITGMYDNATRWNGVAPNHQYKIILGVLLFLVTASTSLLRWKKPDLFEKKSTKFLYVGAYVISFALAGVLGFLGGIIVFG
jgi:uncharacterized membrane protein